MDTVVMCWGGTLSWTSVNEPVADGDWAGCARALLAYGLPKAERDPTDPERVLVDGRVARFSPKITDVLLGAEAAPLDGDGIRSQTHWLEELHRLGACLIAPPRHSNIAPAGWLRSLLQWRFGTPRDGSAGTGAACVGFRPCAATPGKRSSESAG